MKLKLLNEDEIKFYLNKKEHYPISDLFMQNYRQEERGYINLHNVFVSDADEDYEKLVKKQRLKSYEGDLKIYGELKNNYKELIKEQRLTWLKDLDKNFILVERRQYSKLEPNRKWHLLIFWYAYKIIMDVYDVEIGDARRLEENTEVNNWCGVKCPELCLWMLEAACDNRIITLEDIFEMYTEAVEIRRKKLKKSCSLIYWEKIKKVIMKEEN